MGGKKCSLYVARAMTKCPLTQGVCLLPTGGVTHALHLGQLFMFQKFELTMVNSI